MTNGVKIIRSATFEGMADACGFPGPRYRRYYGMLSRHVQKMVSGFLYVSEAGRAMHPGQAGMDSAEKAAAFRPVTQAVHANGAQIIAQIAHVGRQTNRADAQGVSAKKSPYFGVTPKVLATTEIDGIIEDFARAAGFAREAGFDGVQLHCAHGYLIHQFLLRSINDRPDAYGDRRLFLERVIRAVRARCGADFPLWVKISADVDIEPFSRDDFLALIDKLDACRVDAIEVSRGTMDVALNIFRGQVPLRAILRFNPIIASKSLLWKITRLPFERAKIKGFRPAYNLAYAQWAQARTTIPVYAVGGFRSGGEILGSGLKHISLCRPFICEPNFLEKLAADPGYTSKCVNCNLCAVMSDSSQSLRCYLGKTP
jgi:2,4-dienoyl-CoA reductase-like NADH-dependent reductase (Old Yellow Enzyme family)